MRTASSRAIGALPKLLLCLFVLPLIAVKCKPLTTITILSPQPSETISTCSVQIDFEMTGTFTGSAQLFLNFEPVTALVTEGPPGEFHVTIGPEDGLADSNIFTVQRTRAADAQLLTQGVSFAHQPLASARQITQASELITGPLAHSQIGDFLLESCVARFVIQDGAKRDLYSVGQYGGNLIDAERIGTPGVDNFLEVQVMSNVETVINAQTVVIVNDGADGNPAVVRSCGPDDLLDFVNPSSQVTDLGISFPPALNDNDQELEGCTDYSLEARDSHIKMETTLTNVGLTALEVVSGDWMNQGGALDVMMTPNRGVGAAIFNDVGTMAFHGIDEAASVDYAYTSTPVVGVGSYVIISGVTVVLHDLPVLFLLLGLQGGVNVDPGQSHVLTRYFGVNDGSGSNAVDFELAIKGGAKGRIDGCVTVNGVSAPGAKVTVAEFDGGGLPTVLATSFVTDANGCYAGDVPVPVDPTTYGVVAARKGTPYEGGGAAPVIHNIAFSPGTSHTVDIDLPETGSLQVTSMDAGGSVIPARVTVVGIDPSPEITVPGPSLPGFGGSTLALFDDPGDSLPFGIVQVGHTGADGVVSFDVEPGSYRVIVSRGTEYSMSDEAVTITAGNQTAVVGQIAQVIDSAGFVSSDFHVHGINSADSRVTHIKRVEGYAGEGVDNIVMTDHHVHTDLDPTIAALGLGSWVSSSIGEEITTFDYGHFNAYPMAIDPTVPSRGSTDWAVAEPPGQDFPSAGGFNATPGEIFVLATTGANSTADTTVQINHISSHFAPLKIDTSLVPPADGLDAAMRLERRLDEPLTTNLFFHFPALELWNGDSRGSQNGFIDERIGIWFNLLNQGLETTFIADTDSHRFTNLGMAGARTWTAASLGTEQPGNVDSGEVANMVDAGKATGGQGIFVTTQLRATDGSGDVADLTRFGDIHMSDASGNVELDIRIQAPIWAPFDQVEIYANAATTAVDPLNPYLYSATPTMTLGEGDCDATTTGDGDFDVSVVSVAPAVTGGDRLESNITVPFSGLVTDTWFVVVVRGSDGVCPAMFPVYPSGIATGTNATAADLMDGNVGESGVLAMGATNAVYFDAP
jgi:hypothetical protein